MLVCMSTKKTSKRESARSEKTPKKKPLLRDKSTATVSGIAKRNSIGTKNITPHQFKPGQSGNPLGGRAHDPELRAVKNLTKKELADVGNLIIKNDFDALKKLAKDAKATVLQRMLASIAARIIDKGDMTALDILLNRLVGKVKDEVALSNMPQVTVTLPSNGREAK